MSYLQCLLILIGSLFIINTGATIYCNASTTLNNLSGRIEEPIGGGNYRDQMECVWILNSPNSANFLTVQFVRFDLEYGYDYVTISSGDFQTRWHGYQLPQPLAVPVVSGSPVRISFATDQLVTFTGFALTYSFTTCSNPCLNGYCSNGQCVCYPGWNGATCEQSYCPNNCGHGTCQLGQCECNAGYTGADCTQLSPQHCSGLIPITGNSGNFTDHVPWYLPYKGNTNCKWLISTGSTGPITIATALHQFDWFDSLVVYDGDSESSPRLGSLSYSGFAVSPLISRVSSGNLFVVFSSDDNAEYTGFTALFSRNDQCPNSCSGNGYCIEGKCACFSGKMGISCNQDSVATPLTKDQLIKDYANDFEWKYYSYSFPCTAVENTELTFQMRKLIDTPPSTTYSSHWKWGGGDLVYLLGFNYLPSFARNMGGKSYWQYPPDLEIQNPSCNGTYYVAIYGREASYFTIRPTFDASPTSAPSVDNSNTIPTQPATSGSEQSSGKKHSNIGLIAGVAIVVISLVLFAITAVAYYFFKVRRANAGPRFEMVPTEEPDE